MQPSIPQRCLQNWKPALTVALVSVPLSLALAIASGATPTQGIITAFWAGLLGGLLGGSHFNVTGPTGALSGMLVGYAFAHGHAALSVVAVLSGGFILLSYFLRLDRYIVFIPRSVVHGFTLGVAFIIALGQLDNALGLRDIPKTGHLLANLWASLQHAGEIQWPVFGIFLTVTFFILLWNKRFPKVPGAILAAFFAIAFSWWMHRPDFPPLLHMETLGDRYPVLHGALFENIFSGFSWDILLWRDTWVVAAATALIAILETLLSGQIADTMTGTKFDRSREVFGLAIANIGSGLMGGIPATAALARTALNIKSGGNHRTAGMLNALLVGAIALFFFPFFSLLPMAVIASVLTVVAIGMVGKKHFIRLIENEKTAFFLSMLVAAVTVAEDPIAGILVGTFIALLIFVNRVSYGQTEVLIWKNGKMVDAVLKNEFLKKDAVASDIIVYKISGTLTYVNMPAHLDAVHKIKGNAHVIISLRHAFYADSDGVEYLKELIEVLKGNNQKVLIAGVNKEIEKLIVKEPFYKTKLVEGKIYKRTSEAISEILGR